MEFSFGKSNNLHKNCKVYPNYKSKTQSQILFYWSVHGEFVQKVSMDNQYTKEDGNLSPCKIGLVDSMLRNRNFRVMREIYCIVICNNINTH